MRAPLVVSSIALLLVVAGCGGSSSSSSSSQSPTATATATASPAPPGTSYYVSVGDSYAAGYQATGKHAGGTTTHGFAYQAVTDARAKGYDYTLVNFGCSGATTQSILDTQGCPAEDLGPGAAAYDDQTQAAAAEAFLKAHPGQVGLITVSVGGNDIISCGVSPDPLGCVTKTLAGVTSNLTTILSGLRAAAGPETRIVGTTYPDILLAALLTKDAAAQGIAKLSVAAFRSVINPQLEAAYEAVDASFVDVTAATGAYGSLTRLTTLAPYGSIPVPVATLCRLTYVCEYDDIHPRTPGYALIARLVVGTLPKR